MDQPPPSYNETVNPQFYALNPNQRPMSNQPAPPYQQFQIPMEHHVVYTTQGRPGDVITQQPTTIVIVQQSE